MNTTSILLLRFTESDYNMRPKKIKKNKCITSWHVNQAAKE